MCLQKIYKILLLQGIGLKWHKTNLPPHCAETRLDRAPTSFHQILSALWAVAPRLSPQSDRSPVPWHNTTMVRRWLIANAAAWVHNGEKLPLQTQQASVLEDDNLLLQPQRATIIKDDKPLLQRQRAYVRNDGKLDVSKWRTTRYSRMSWNYSSTKMTFN